MEMNDPPNPLTQLIRSIGSGLFLVLYLVFFFVIVLPILLITTLIRKIAPGLYEKFSEPSPKPSTPENDALNDLFLRGFFEHGDAQIQWLYLMRDRFALIVPRKVMLKYLLKRYSPENLSAYIDDVKAAQDHDKLDAHDFVARLLPAYDLLQRAVRDHQADELRISVDPVGLTLLRNQELVGFGYYWLHQALQADNPSITLRRVEDMIQEIRFWLIPLHAHDPILRRWTLLKYMGSDERGEVVVYIGSDAKKRHADQ